MRLDVNISPLWKQVAQMGASAVEFEIGYVWDQSDIELDDELSGGGFTVQLQDLEVESGLLSVKGRQVILFIPDHGWRIGKAIEDPAQGKKFHVADCETLATMRKKNRFERYRVTNNLSGIFPIFGTEGAGRQYVEADVELNVCKNCLKYLNYKGAERGASSLRSQIVRDFSIEEFFSRFSSVFKYLPKNHIESSRGGYPSNWSSISQEVREAARFVCQSCQVDLSSRKKLLHVHHVNGDKSDSVIENLRCLCVDCHRKEPDHDHMVVRRKDMIEITRLRRQQDGARKQTWERVRKVCDPAVEGVLDYCESLGMDVPEVGFELTTTSRSTAIVLELAWPSIKEGICLEGGVVFSGWKVYGLREALDRYRDVFSG